MSRTSTRVRSRVRTQWLALGAAFVVLAGVLVAWALSSAADRVQVVQVAVPVRAGQVITAEALTITGIAYDAELQGLVPAASLEALAGRVAAIDLQPGSLLLAGMWREAPLIAAGEEAVGAVLNAGRFPSGLARGDVAVAAPVDAASTATTVVVRVIAAELGAEGELFVTLAVPADRSVTVAQLAANDLLLLVGRTTAVGS